MGYKALDITTGSRDQFIDITSRIEELLASSGAKSGVCIIFVPHTTAAVTINENADPSVISDMLMYLDESVPWTHRRYGHAEGNSAAHIKSSLIGSSVSVIIENGRLSLGTWQSVFFCEFDGPRRRKAWVRVLED